MIKKIFLGCLCVFVCFSYGQIGFGQDNDTVRHYILLLDATAPFRGAIGNNNYFSYIEEMINIEPDRVHREYLPYRADRDVVSIVFFHFPINKGSRKIINEGLHTSPSLAFIQGGIVRRRSTIESVIDSKLEKFRELAVSPIGLSEVTVAPFINDYINRRKISLDQRIDRIYLISLSDEKYNVEEAGIRSALKSFDSRSRKNYYEKLRNHMKNNFTPMALLKNIKKRAISPSGSSGNVYFHYYEIKPKIEGIKLKLTNKVALARTALKSDNPGEEKMYWMGTNDVCLDNQTEYPAWVEWALPPGEGEEWNWRNCVSEPGDSHTGLKVLSAGCRAGCAGTSPTTKPVVQIFKKETLWAPEEEAKRFKVEIRYRGVMDIPRPNQPLAYPFKFRYYLPPQRVEYVSNEVGGSGEGKVPHFHQYDVSWYSPENLLAFFTTRIERTEINDNLLKEKLASEDFTARLARFIRKDKLPARFKEYCDEFRGKTVTQLPAEVLSETSKIKALHAENRGKWSALILYILFAGALFFGYRLYLRPIIVRFNIDPVTKKNNTITLDFSGEIKNKEVLATFELENLVYSLHPAKKNPRFKLSFNVNCEFSFPGEPLNVIHDRENLLSVMDKSNNKEYVLRTSGNSFYATIPDVLFKRKFEILLNLSKIKDVEADNIGDKLIPFSLSLTSPEAKLRNGKNLHIHKIKNGLVESSQKTWAYSANLHFKPETHKHDIVITPMDGVFASANTRTTIGTGTGRENHALDYTSKTPLVKLFDVEIRNNNLHHFSFPVDGTFSFEVKGSGNTAVADIFYLSERDAGSFGNGVFIREIPIRLKKSDVRKRLSLYIHFDDFSNPVDHCDYTLNCYFNGDIVRTLNIRINRSKEETEALVQVVDGDDALELETVDADNITDDNSFLVHNKTANSIPVSVNIPSADRKGIKEGIDTRLFTVVLKNNCCTRTGFYNWELENLSVTGGSGIEFDGNPLKISPKENSGTVNDHRDSEQEIEISMDHSKIKKVHSYQFGFSLKFSINIQLFPQGDIGGKPAPTGGQKQIDFSLNVLCFHDVKDNYLVIDFGTSAICANYFTYYGKTSEDNYLTIPLHSPEGHLESENDLLPSIINLRNLKRDGVKDTQTVGEVDDSSKVAVAGSKQFVDLPARDGIFSACPDTVLNSIKLLIVQGTNIVPIPEEVDFGMYGEKIPFAFVNENGDLQQGSPTLGSVLKSCYEYLLENYIKDLRGTDKRRYRKVVLTYPNVYNCSHITFLEEEVFRYVFEESGRVYHENIGKESESNSVLYYYLSKRGDSDIPDNEHILIIDIGAGTLDMSFAQVEWDTSDSEAITPVRIEVIKRDGIAMAGDSLDKAIALQIHDILKRFIGFEDVNYANRIAANEELMFDKAREMDYRKIMLYFKTKHILAYKKSMGTGDDDKIVEICLGDNDENNGLCELAQESHEITIEGEESSTIMVTLANKFGKLYLGMKKNEWLNLPYLKRFKQLLVEKLGAFAGEIDIPDHVTIVSSGRTSLWPSIRESIGVVFNGKNVEMADSIWPVDADEKSVELKRAVILGAIQKATTWREVEFKETEISGVEAVRYQKGRDGSNPNSWKIETFPKDPEKGITINLANSSYFELGIKTTMDFVPFMGADCYRRDDYCKTDKRAILTMERLKNTNGYHFYIKSDKYQRGKGDRLKHVLGYETAFLKARAKSWPVRPAQLPEISSAQFNENV